MQEQEFLLQSSRHGLASYVANMWALCLHNLLFYLALVAMAASQTWGFHLEPIDPNMPMVLLVQLDGEGTQTWWWSDVQVHLQGRTSMLLRTDQGIPSGLPHMYHFHLPLNASTFLNGGAVAHATLNINGTFDAQVWAVKPREASMRNCGIAWIQAPMLRFSRIQHLCSRVQHTQLDTSCYNSLQARRHCKITRREHFQNTSSILLLWMA